MSLSTRMARLDWLAYFICVQSMTPFCLIARAQLRLVKKESSYVPRRHPKVIYHENVRYNDVNLVHVNFAKGQCKHTTLQIINVNRSKQFFQTNTQGTEEKTSMLVCIEFRGWRSSSSGEKWLWSNSSWEWLCQRLFSNHIRDVVWKYLGIRGQLLRRLRSCHHA